MAIEKINIGERHNFGVGKGFNEFVAIPTMAQIELFDGDPIYSGPDGRDISREQILSMDFRDIRSLGSVVDDFEDRMGVLDAGLSDAHRGLLLRPKNRISAQETHNLITQLGLNGLADKIIAGSAITLPTGMKLGTSSTAASLGDTDVLTAAPTGAFQTWVSGYPQRTTNTASWRVFWAGGEAQSATLREVVMKSADGSTDAINRIVFTTIDKSGASDTLQITVNWAMSGA